MSDFGVSVYSGICDMRTKEDKCGTTGSVIKCYIKYWDGYRGVESFCSDVCCCPCLFTCVIIEYSIRCACGIACCVCCCIGSIGNGPPSQAMYIAMPKGLPTPAR